MSDNPINDILQMDGEERYDYFLSEVAEEREIWILINADNQFLKIVSDEDGVAYLPVWPNAGLAADYAKAAGDLSPKTISCRISSRNGFRDSARTVCRLVFSPAQTANCGSPNRKS